MLNLLRRHASSWLIKLVLSLIIISFILFFGYTRYQSRALKLDRVVATVGKIPITRQNFEVTLDDRQEEMRKTFKDLDATVKGFLETNLLQQMIFQNLAFLYTESLGIQVSDQELAQKIRSLPVFAPQGVFDLELYQRHRLIHKNRTGEDLENLLRKDLALEWLNRIAEVCFNPWETERHKQVPIPPEVLLSKWIEQFRDRTKIELYRNPS